VFWGRGKVVLRWEYEGLWEFERDNVELGKKVVNSLRFWEKVAMGDGLYTELAKKSPGGGLVSREPWEKLLKEV
jgi:hypothetical protein